MSTTVAQQWAPDCSLQPADSTFPTHAPMRDFADVSGSSGNLSQLDRRSNLLLAGVARGRSPA
jgi:hypothetical protein